MKPLRRLGQNYLHDDNLSRWMAKAVAASVADDPRPILEIGPGLGSLTAPLLALHRKVLAIEIDRGACVYLREHFANEAEAGQFDLREGDALEEVEPVWSEQGGQFAAVAGNLPYNVSTPLLAKLSRLEPVPEVFVFTLQLEVCERLAASVGTKAYGQLTVLIQMEYRVKILRRLPGSVFFPPPDVDSAVVELRRLTPPLVGPGEREQVARAVRQGFSQRRKKLSNLLPVDDGRRAEELSVAEWIELSRRLRP